jgi:hypothetical protein
VAVETPILGGCDDTEISLFKRFNPSINLENRMSILPRSWKVFFAFLFSGLSGSILSFGQVILIDFGTSAGLASGNWNYLSTSGTISNLVEASTGAGTSVSLALSRGVLVSSSTGQWGTRTEDPVWADDAALGDRFYVSGGAVGTMVISGLAPGGVFDIELASSYGGGGVWGSDAGVYQLTDAAGLVEGYNALRGTPLGSTVLWTTRGPGEGGEEGWIAWYGVVADDSGQIRFTFSPPGGESPRVALNAMRIVSLEDGVDLPEVLEMTGSGEVCPEDGPQIFGVGPSTELDVTYALNRNGTLVQSLKGDGTSLGFAAQTLAGIYTVSGIREGYHVLMAGSATIRDDCSVGAYSWPIWNEMPLMEAVTNTNSPDYPGFPEALRWFDFEAKSPNGPAVSSPVDWYFGRRLEIIDMLKHYMYGRAPDAPLNPVFTVTETVPDAVGGLATRLKILMNFNIDRIPSKAFYLYLPNANTPPHPVIVGLAKPTNPTDWEPGGSRSNRWHIAQTLGRGYALAIISVDELAGDIHNSASWQNPLVVPYANVGFDGDWQIIAAWAWGLSRVVDYLDTNSNIDPNRTIVTGFSRRGKTALWAGALDERFEMVAPHQTGSGGAHPSRSGWGTALTFRTQFPNWFLDSFNTLPAHGGYDRLPFDQHFPVALVAPRWAFLSENPTYGSSYSGLQAIMAGAEPVFEFLDPDNSENLVLSWDFVDPGIHQFTAKHWSSIMDQADKLPISMGGIRGFLEWRRHSGWFTEAESLDDSISGLLADPDRDGQVNLIEFAFGLDPTASSASPVSLRRESQIAKIRFNARAGGRGHPGVEYNSGGVGYTVFVATSPAGPWEPIGESALSYSVTPDGDDPKWGLLEVELPISHPAQFYRVKVNLY